MKVHKFAALSLAVGRNEVSEIEAICNEALATNSGDFMALLMLADTYWRNQRQNDALPFALRALEVEPNDFAALRIAAGVYAERGEQAQAYSYAKRLICAEIPHSPPTKTISRLLAPFAWLPKVRRLSARVNREDSSTSDWLQWANEYVSAYESGDLSAL